MNRKLQRFLAGCALALLSANALASTRYVKVASSGSGDCSTWPNACALSTGLSGAVSGDELWVVAGTYAPFELKNGVRVIGGFAGTEVLAKQSKPAINPTIIDGGGAIQCVTGADLAASTVLRGFTIRNGMDSGYDGGGGVLLNNSSAVIVQCIFEDNKASMFGGAVSVRGSGSPQFVNCTFRNNGHALGLTPIGGGVLFGYQGSPRFTNCLFHGNKAGEGGAIFVVSGTPTFINCTFSDNHSTIGYGGAVFDQEGQATFNNCIVWNNTTTRGVGYADQIFSRGGGASVATYSNIQGGWPGTNNLNVDPQFTNPAGDEFTLAPGSPCRDVGENAALPPDAGNLDWDLDYDEITPKDVLLNARTWGLAVDLGAYEVFMIEE